MVVVIELFPYCRLLWVSDILAKSFKFTQHTSKLKSNHQTLFLYSEKQLITGK